MMGRRSPDPLLLEYLSAREPHIAALALQARDAVLEEIPTALEKTTNVKYAIVVNFSFVPGIKGVFCGIVIYPRHINLGFFQGARLPDPGKLLEGTGKAHRHTRIENVEDLQRPQLRRLIHAAAQLAESEFPPGKSLKKVSGARRRA
jgi:hypothetical protein